jgi:phenylacetate-coenzyme A ligase PaaK-like adenylate-forming protein
MKKYEDYIAEMNNRLKNYIPNKLNHGEESVFKPHDLFDMPDKEANEYKFKAIKYAFKLHYEKNSFYRKYCKEKNVTPDDIKSTDDFIKIPLLPDKFFKAYPSGNEFAMWLATIYTGDLPNITIKKNYGYDEIINKFNEAGLVISYSSGTSGRHTFIPRDLRTFNASEYAIAKSVIGMAYPIWEYEMNGYLFMPNPMKTNVFA